MCRRYSEWQSHVVVVVIIDVVLQIGQPTLNRNVKWTLLRRGSRARARRCSSANQRSANRDHYQRYRTMSYVVVLELVVVVFVLVVSSGYCGGTSSLLELLVVVVVVVVVLQRCE